MASFEEQYRAATDGVALLDRSDRGKLAVSGADAVGFLDSLLSNDLGALSAGSGAEATLLTHKGRMLATVRVLREADEVLLDCERVALQALFDGLRRFTIGYDAELHKRTLECGQLSLLGPHADSALASPPGFTEHSHHRTTISGHDIRAVRTDLGIDVSCASEELDAVSAALQRAGARVIDEDVAECVRIEHGRPRFGVDIDETTMPQEAGLHERAVSYRKGCYVGQETVARLYWKGRPNRILRGLVLGSPASPGSPVHLGEDLVGHLGSVAVSPRLGPISLTLLRREADIGSILTVGEGAAGRATVVELPFAGARPSRPARYTIAP